MQAKASYDNDQALQEMMERLGLYRLQLQSLVKEKNPDQGKIDQKNRELQDVFSQMSSNLTMQSYQAASMKLNDLLSNVQSIITAAANGEDPETFDPAQNCKGDCSSCSGQCQ